MRCAAYRPADVCQHGLHLCVLAEQHVVTAVWTLFQAVVALPKREEVRQRDRVKLPALIHPKQAEVEAKGHPNSLQIKEVHAYHLPKDASTARRPTNASGMGESVLWEGKARGTLCGSPVLCGPCRVRQGLGCGWREGFVGMVDCRVSRRFVGRLMCRGRVWCHILV